MQHWEKVPDKKKAAEDSYNAIFLFKKKIFLKDDEKEMEDPVAMDLIYQQAGRYSSSSFLCSFLSLFCSSSSFPFLPPSNVSFQYQTSHLLFTLAPHKMPLSLLVCFLVLFCFPISLLIFFFPCPLFFL